MEFSDQAIHDALTGLFNRRAFEHRLEETLGRARQGGEELPGAGAELHGVGELGCQSALDDFGAGLSSLTYLGSLPVHCLKIDGVFVRDVVREETDRAKVCAINEIGQTLGNRLWPGLWKRTLPLRAFHKQAWMLPGALVFTDLAPSKCCCRKPGREVAPIDGCSRGDWDSLTTSM